MGTYGLFELSIPEFFLLTIAYFLVLYFVVGALSLQLLSTVPLTLILFCPLSPLALGIYSLTSILLNFAGHSNVRFGNGSGNAV